MKFSNFFIPTLKENPSDARIVSHILMLKSGMIRQETSGIYSWLPLGYRVLKKIIKIIEDLHELYEVNQILMPTIQSSEIWKKSGRYDTYGKEMLRINDRHSKELLYGPTNEEMITALGKQHIKSYKSLPQYFYHIQSKFRDEIRPRFGVMRAREFLMKDAYSFDINENEGEKTYYRFFRLYLKIFKSMGIPIVPVRALSGEIGGSLSHEFHLIVDSGESEIFLDKSILESNLEKLKDEDLKNLNSFTDEYYKNNKISIKLEKFRSIELGHIFLFGDKYSKSFDFNIEYENKKLTPFMGSYGIGISRIPAAIIEHSSDERGILWPEEVSPFEVVIINLINDSDETNKVSNDLYQNLKSKNIDVIYDDRNERPGIKFSDSDLIGIPIQIIIGKNLINDGNVTLKFRKDGKEINLTNDKVLDIIIKKLKNNK